MTHKSLFNQYNYKDIIILIVSLFYLFFDSLMNALTMEGWAPNRNSSVQGFQYDPYFFSAVRYKNTRCIRAYIKGGPYL